MRLIKVVTRLIDVEMRLIKVEIGCSTLKWGWSTLKPSRYYFNIGPISDFNIGRISVLQSWPNMGPMCKIISEKWRPASGRIVSISDNRSISCWYQFHMSARCRFLYIGTVSIINIVWFIVEITHMFELSAHYVLHSISTKTGLSIQWLESFCSSSTVFWGSCILWPHYRKRSFNRCLITVCLTVLPLMIKYDTWNNGHV